VLVEQEYAQQGKAARGLLRPGAPSIAPLSHAMGGVRMLPCGDSKP
jgi:hypothetical protein